MPIDQGPWYASISAPRNRRGIPPKPCKGRDNSRISKALTRHRSGPKARDLSYQLSSVTICTNIDGTNKHASDIALAARTHRFGSAFAKSRGQTKLALSKEIVMNTEKVIELGKVSEETKGSIPVDFEGPDMTPGLDA
jgi:hypothetical protein